MKQLQEGQGQLAERLQAAAWRRCRGSRASRANKARTGQGQQGQNGQGGQPGDELGRSLGRAGRAMGDASRSLGQQAPGDAYGYQGEALDALREGLQGMMQQMYAQQPGQQGQQMGGRTTGDRDPLGRPQRTEGPDLGQTREGARRDRRGARAPHPGGDPRAPRRALPPALRARLPGAAAQRE